MNTMLVLCLAALLGAAQAQGGRGRFARRGAVNHLDVGLPNPLFGSNSPLLIHLKDQGLYDKENGADDGRSRASLLPSVLKSISMNQHQNEPSEFDYRDVSSNTGLNSPLSMVRSLFDEGALPDLQELEEMVQDDELAHELYASEMTEDRAHFFFKLRDALKNMNSQEKEAQTEGSKGLRSQAGREAGLWFNLEDLESQLKKTFPGREKIDLGSGDVSEKQVLVNLVELLKEYVEKETSATSDPQPMEETEYAKNLENETAANIKMLEELKRSNVTVQGVDSTGGIFFSLADEQESGEDTTET